MESADASAASIAAARLAGGPNTITAEGDAASAPAAMPPNQTTIAIAAPASTRLASRRGQSQTRQRHKDQQQSGEKQPDGPARQRFDGREVQQRARPVGDSDKVAPGGERRL
jgi:hypothetical protein